MLGQETVAWDLGSERGHQGQGPGGMQGAEPPRGVITKGAWGEGPGAARGPQTREWRDPTTRVPQVQSQ